MKVNHNLKNSVMEAVENQLSGNNPKATRETFNKLMALGYTEIMAKEKIAAAVIENIYQMLKQKRQFDESVFSGKLAAMILEETAKHANQGV